MSGTALPEKGTLLSTLKPDAGGPGAADLVTEGQVIKTFLMQDAGVVIDPVVNAYIATIVDRLVAGWPGPRPPLAYYVVPTAELTAEATANGGLMVTTGSLAYLAHHPEVRTEDHFSFLIAHELSHILLGHTRDRTDTLLWMHRASGAASLGFALLPKVMNPGLAGSLGKLGLDRSSAGQLGALGLTALSENVMFPTWSRAQERRADVLAIDLMAKAGYAVDAVPDILAIVVAAEARDATEADRKRADTAQRAQEAAKADAGAKGQILLFHADAGGAAATLKSLTGGLTSAHPAAVERVTDANAYINREYADLLVKKRAAEFERFANRREVRTLLADAALLDDATVEIGRNQPKAAIAKLRSLGTSPVARSARARLLLARAQLQAGQDTTALATLQEAGANPYATFPLQMAMASQLEMSGQLPQALEAYQKAQAQFDDPTPYPNRIRILKRLGRTNELSLLRAGCIADGTPQIRLDCDEASK